jgi:trehalose-6-phosphatase
VIQTLAGGGIFASDYDGCASPLHDDAEAAWRIRGFLPAVQELGARPDGLVVMISGRPRRLTPDGKRGIEDFLSTSNVHDRDPITGGNVVGTEIPVGRFDDTGLGYTLDGRRGKVYVIANHGADLDPGLIQTDQDKAFAAKLFAPMSEADSAIRERLLAELPAYLRERFPNLPLTEEVDLEQPDRIYLEAKSEGMAVHVRTLAEPREDDSAEVAAARRQLGEQILQATQEFYLTKAAEWGHELHATPGSNVLDIQVRPASKGRPIIYLENKFPDRPIAYVGDDVTDLAAMRELRAGDTAIVVGDRIPEELERQGQPLTETEGVNVLYLADPGELATFLRDAVDEASRQRTPRVQARRTGPAHGAASPHLPGEMHEDLALDPKPTHRANHVGVLPENVANSAFPMTFSGKTSHHDTGS